MTSVVTTWSDSSVTKVAGAFTGPANFDLIQLVSEITAAGIPVTRDLYSIEAWSSGGEDHPADTIQLWVSVTQDAGRKAAEEAAIAEHVPLNYQMGTTKLANWHPTSGAEVVALVQVPYSDSTYAVNFQATCLGVDRDDPSSSVSFFSSRGGGMDSGVVTLHSGFGGIEKSVSLDAANVSITFENGVMTMTVTGVAERNIDWAGEVSLITIEPSR